MRSHCNRSYLQRYRQQGIALIEILISVLVLGIGLLGIAALQSSSVR